MHQASLSVEDKTGGCRRSSLDASALTFAEYPKEARRSGLPRMLNPPKSETPLGSVFSQLNQSRSEIPILSGPRPCQRRCRLGPTDVDTCQGRDAFALTTKKRKRDVWCPIMPTLAAEMQTWEGRPGPYLLQRNGKPFTRKGSKLASAASTR